MDSVDYLATLSNYYDYFGFAKPFVAVRCPVVSRRCHFPLLLSCPSEFSHVYIASHWWILPFIDGMAPFMDGRKFHEILTEVRFVRLFPLEREADKLDELSRFLEWEVDVAAETCWPARILRSASKSCLSVWSYYGQQAW